MKVPRLTWPRTRLHGWTRPQLFWCAALWLCNQHLLEMRRRYTQELDAAYTELGKRLWAMCLRPSPLMVAMGAK